MADETAVEARPGDTRAEMQASEDKLRRISANLREIYRRTRENIDRVDDEQKKTEAEKALANIMREYDPFIQSTERKMFGRGIEREQIGAVKRDDESAVRQRFAASREAEEGRGQAPAPADDRTMKARERLERADAQAAQLFTQRGMNSEIAMQRVRDAPKVDLETRDKWMDRDIAALARSSNVSEAEARKTTQAAYRDAAKIYQKARDDIREIKRTPDQSQAQAKDRTTLKRGASRDRDRGIDR